MKETISEETWRAIPGLPDYEVSCLGRVRRLGHYEKTRARWGLMTRRRNFLVLNPHKRRNGYLVYGIREKNYFAHRLVAMAFLGLPSEGMVVNHLNGDKRDNRPENLQWVTPSENELHSYHKLGKRPWNYGRPYDTSKAVAVRRVNYEKKCLETLEDYERSGLSVRKYADAIGLSDVAVYARLRRAREVKANGEGSCD